MAAFTYFSGKMPSSSYAADARWCPKASFAVTPIGDRQLRVRQTVVAVGGFGLNVRSTPLVELSSARTLPNVSKCVTSISRTYASMEGVAPLGGG
ncbi:hypothetical protein BE20_03185 [Sorangium cellulosum]|nr:hypothetical protein BE20_03185 [Sorangium cellulosum]